MLRTLLALIGTALTSCSPILQADVIQSTPAISGEARIFIEFIPGTERAQIVHENLVEELRKVDPSIDVVESVSGAEFRFLVQISDKYICLDQCDSVESRGLTYWYMSGYRPPFGNDDNFVVLLNGTRDYFSARAERLMARQISSFLRQSAEKKIK